jgi:CheY-like chemotaxis protein
MKMPGMSGLDLLNAVRKSGHHPDTRFLLITGQKTAYFSAPEKLGAKAILVKPFSPETLVNTIERIFPVQPSAA